MKSLSHCAIALFLVTIPCAGQIRAGAAKRSITPDLKAHSPVFLAGFGHNRVATGIHDDLYARCLALSAGQRPLVICGVDSIGLFLDDTAKIRARIEADAVIAALHDHEAPDTMGLWGAAPGQSGINEAYNQYVVDRTVEAAREALRMLEPAVITLARAHEAGLDTFIDDDRPPVLHDTEIIALRAVSRSGKAIGTLINWANHPETVGSKNTLITADYCAYLYRHTEALLGGTAVFVNGAVGGMQSSLGATVKDPATGRPAEELSFRKAEVIGSRVAELAANGLKKARPASIDRIDFRERIVEIPMRNKNYVAASQSGVFKGRKNPTPDGATRTPVGYIRMSRQGKPHLEIALVPGELYPELSVGGIERYPEADFPDAPLEPALKQLMTAPYRMLFGLANDEIGYIIPRAEWDEQPPYLKGSAKRWYGEVNSVGPDAAPVITKAFSELVR